jgi:hypothetical protein
MPTTRIELEETDRGWIGTVEAGGPAGRRAIAFPSPGIRIATFEDALHSATLAHREIVGHIVPPNADTLPNTPVARRKPR